MNFCSRSTFSMLLTTGLAGGLFVGNADAQTALLSTELVAQTASENEAIESADMNSNLDIVYALSIADPNSAESATHIYLDDGSGDPISVAASGGSILSVDNPVIFESGKVAYLQVVEQDRGEPNLFEIIYDNSVLLSTTDALGQLTRSGEEDLHFTRIDAATQAVCIYRSEAGGEPTQIACPCDGEANDFCNVTLGSQSVGAEDLAYLVTAFDMADLSNALVELRRWDPIAEAEEVVSEFKFGALVSRPHITADGVAYVYAFDEDHADFATSGLYAITLSDGSATMLREIGLPGDSNGLSEFATPLTRPVVNDRDLMAAGVLSGMNELILADLINEFAGDPFTALVECPRPCEDDKFTGPFQVESVTESDFILIRANVDIGRKQDDAQFAGVLIVIGIDLPSGIDPCASDLNGDDVVNVFDLLSLLGDWGACADPDDCPADLNGDGVVNVFDLLILLANWGECP